MKKQYIIAICIIAFFTSLIITMNIVKENKLQNTKKEAKISEKVEDECTEECTKETKIEEVVATKEKVSANSQLIIKKYFKQCDHTINEYVEMPQELVNLTKEEVQNKYNDWKVIGFEPNKVTLYKEFDEKIVGYTMHINYGFLKKMIPDIKNIYFNIDEPFLNKKITKYMMDIYSFYISDQSTKYMNILMVHWKC